MKTLTVSDIMATRPCYSESRVRELFGDRESLSLIEILRLDIPAEDRLWVLIGMAAALCCSIDDIVSARRRGDHE